jgi:3-deoxy-D-manno-octulosonate 8-phosphate phosphatase (KDO 8-P phosphatase)
MIELIRNNLKFLLQAKAFQGRELSSGLLARLNALYNSKADSIEVSLIEALAEQGIPAGLFFHRRFEDISNKLNNIKLVVFDVDGVMTDAGMYYSESGDEFKRFHARDGIGIKRLHENGFLTGVISHGINKNLIAKRCELLAIKHVYAGSENKLSVLSLWLNDLKLELSQVAFIGDDINDLPLLEKVGFSACPADAVTSVKSKVDLVLEKSGGQGAIRELVDRCFVKNLV